MFCEHLLSQVEFGEGFLAKFGLEFSKNSGVFGKFYEFWLKFEDFEQNFMIFALKFPIS